MERFGNYGAGVAVRVGVGAVVPPGVRLGVAVSLGARAGAAVGERGTTVGDGEAGIGVLVRVAVAVELLDVGVAGTLTVVAVGVVFGPGVPPPLIVGV